MGLLAAKVTAHQPDSSTLPLASGRLMSLDLLRGATIAAMILVNNPGDEQSAYWPLQHAAWNGWTPTDLIFPFFLFVVGVSMVYSLSSRLGRGESRGKIFSHALRRGVVIFALGLFLNGFPNHYQLSSWRVYGVLQRIAICYVVAAVLVLWGGRRSQIITILGCLAGYWILMRYVPVPGFGMPTRDIPLLDPNRNIVAWMDRKVLAGHLYEITRDPEGILSTIPAIATTLLGVLTGYWLRSAHAAKEKATGLLGYGVVLLAAAELVNVWFPINKKLWTSSFVLFTAGMALLFLAACYWMVDVRQWRGRWTEIFLVFGMNAIAAYFVAEIVAHWLSRMQVATDGTSTTWQDFIYQRVFAGWGSPSFSSLLYAITYVVLCWLVMGMLYRRKIFIKI